MKEYSEYAYFHCSFKKRFQSFSKQYPLLFLLLEKELRNYHAGRKELFKQNIKAVGNKSFHRKLAYRLYELMLYMMPKFLAGPNEKVFTDLSRFPDVLEEMNTISKENSLNVLERSKILSLALRGGDVSRLISHNPVILTVFKEIDSLGVESFLCHHELLSRHERDLEKLFEKVKRFLIDLKIKFIVSDGDSTYYSRLLCEAAKSVSCRYIVVCHGYIQDPNLISIAPVSADILYVWSESQRDLVNKLTDFTFEKKIKVLGYPFRKSPIIEVKNNNVLFVSEPFSQMEYHNEPNWFDMIVDSLKNLGLRVRVRLHPKDRSRQILLDKVASLDCEIAHGTLDEELSKVSLVIGTNSSVLFEASERGKNAWQIKDFKIHDFEGVDEVELCMIKKIINRSASQNMENDKSEIRIMDMYEILREEMCS